MNRILRLIPKREVLFEKIKSSQADIDYIACECFLLNMFDKAIFMRINHLDINEGIALFDRHKKILLLEIEMDKSTKKIFKKTGEILINISNDKEKNNTLWFNEKKILLELYGILGINDDDVEVHIHERIIDVLILFVKKFKIVNDEVDTNSVNRFAFELYEKYNFKNYSVIK